MLTPLDGLIEKYGLKISGVLHVGAHIGEEADAYNMASVPRVLWVEANPEIIPELTKNVGRYGHQVVNACVSATDDMDFVLHVTNNVMSSSVLPLGTHKKRAPKVVYTHDIEMKTKTIDTICQQHNFHEFNVINMDIQGAELLALRGGSKALRHTEWIFTEINFDELYVGCARAWELDEFLWYEGFYRCETWMAGNDVGWGDALYARRTYAR